MLGVRWSGRSWWGVILAPLLALVAADLSAQATTGKPKELKLSVAVGPAFALGKAGEQWAKRVTERSGGALSVVASPGATLAQRDPAREFAALRDGAVDLAVGSSLFWWVQVRRSDCHGSPRTPGNSMR
jgi:TRAP-type transport system periplasmic protein